MKELTAIFDALRRTSAPAALATLVKVEGSSYRRAGARLLWWPGAVERIGSISGGCLEDDVIERCREVLTTGKQQHVVYDTTDENDLVWGVGLGCNGIVQVIIERIAGLPPSFQFVSNSWLRREAVVLATVYKSSNGDGLGTKCARGENDLSWTDPALPDPWRTPLHEGAVATLDARRSHAAVVSAGADTLEVFFEYIPPPPSLVIFGAGNDAKPLVDIAKGLGWDVSVVDARPAYATAARFPQADRVLVARPPDAAHAVRLDAHTLVVVMTHHYLHDVPLLRSLLPMPLAYLGLLGPKKRAVKILDELSASGMPITDEMRARLRAPTGLDLGASTPEEVALSIVAEIQTVLRQRDGRPLRQRERPIHD
jgi:xanthine/CO dehydrogenase XdhC/CoxF family maturation factor